MLKILLTILITAAALLLIATYVPGIAVASFYTALIVAVIWGLFSVTVRPLLNLLALPINLITFGLFSFIINALLFWFIATFVAGFSVEGFLPALEGSLILTLVGWVLHNAL